MADPVPKTLGEYIDQQARQYHVPVALANAILDQESGGVHATNGQVKTSDQGAVGMFQLLPGTAFGEFNLNPSDPFENIQAGIRYLRKGLDATGNDPIAAAAYYHGGPDLRQHGPRTRQYAADIDRRLRERLGIAPAPTSAPGTARAASLASPAAPAARGGPPAPPSPTQFETEPTGIWFGQGETPRSSFPPDIQAQLDYVRQQQASSPQRAQLFHPSTWGPDPSQGPDVLAQRGRQLGEAYDPRTRTGRRNIAGTGAAIVAAPAIIAALPAAAAGSAIAGIGVSAGTAALGGIGAEFAEQTMERDWGGRPAYDVPAIAGAGGEQAAYDIFGHAILGGPRMVARKVIGPGIGAEAAERWAMDRKTALNAVRAAKDSLVAAHDWFKGLWATTNAGARATAAETTAGLKTAQDLAVTAAKERAAEALGQAQGVTHRNVGVAQQLADTGTADATAAAEEARRALTSDYETRNLGPTPSSPTAVGRQVADVIQGPGQAAHDILGQARDAAALTGPERDLTRLQEEGRRMVEQEILPPERTFPGEVSAGPPVFDPQYQTAITDEQRAAIARHPAIPIIQRILNAPRKVPFQDLALWYKQLASSADWENPAAGIIEGARKHLLGMMREELAVHEPYNAAAAAYEASYTKMKMGYAADIAKTARTEPARAVQMITPNDPELTQQLMSVLTEHSPEVAAELRKAWLQRNILHGGLDTLSQRLQLLTGKNAEFAHSLLGDTHAVTMQHLSGWAAAWENMVRGAEQGTAEAATAGSRGVSAAEKLGADRLKDTRELGAAGVEAAKSRVQTMIDTHATATAADAATRQAAKRAGVQEYKTAMRAQTAKGQAAREITDAEATALGMADDKARAALDAIFGLTVPTKFRGAFGLVRLLRSASSADLLKIANARPEVNRLLVDWLADPNVRASYQLIKHVLGTEVGGAVEPYASGALAKARQQQVGKPLPKPGATILAIAPPSTPPPPPPKSQPSEIGATISNTPRRQ